MRRAILTGACVALVAVAFWMRTAQLTAVGVGRKSVEESVSVLRASLTAEVARLGNLADAALAIPRDQTEAFRALAALDIKEDFESVVVLDSAPRAWVGKPRVRVDGIVAPLSITRDAFLTVLHVVREKSGARAVASTVVYALPPASRVVDGLVNKIGRQAGVHFDLNVSADSLSDAAAPIVAAANRGLLFAVASSRNPAELRFERAARTRALLGVALLIGFLIVLGAAWRERKDLALRLVAIGTGLVITGLVPWSDFSNSSRAFDPAFYFSRVGGPYTANAAALLATVVLLLMGVFALTRARSWRSMPRPVAGALAICILAAGLAIGSNILRGVGQPSWGSTPGLWLSWELPVFLFLLTVLIAFASLARMAFARASMLSARAVLSIAFIAALVTNAALWVTTTRQRMRLAERDLSALTRVDESEDVLVRRFLEDLSRAKTPASAADLLRLYSSSELSAAEFPVVLETRRGSQRVARLDLAPGATDSSSTVSSSAFPAAGTVTTVLGTIGVQMAGAAVHSDGAITTTIVLPHTRLVGAPAFAPLLGVSPPVRGDPPYTVTMPEGGRGVPADMGRVVWHRIDDQWHGDRLIPTSAGLKRAHVEVDMRSIFARGERGILIVLLDVLLAGLLWLLGAAAERPFLRLLRRRGAKWARTYRARLTLALFAFFIIPALAFALWSYQRLRTDDRQTRELLVNETLATLSAGTAAGDLQRAGERFDTPLFRYSAGFLDSASDPLYGSLAPGGVALPRDVQLEIGVRGELTAAAEQRVGAVDALFGYRAARGTNEEPFILSAPARSDDLVLDRRRRDLGMLVLFATALGAVAALWLSGVAAKRLARDLELSRIEVARAERIIAWGEMARQVAHEIKNPLTPIRLGVQHLRRARKDNRADFDKVLDDNVARILSEIDRLDSIARSFSRYGSAPADLLPAERVDVSAVLRDIVALEQMGKGEVKWRLRGAEHSMLAMSRAEELREVMLNILENARLAGARRVVITLREEEKRVTIETCDDGSGIPASALTRLFEPHFSTRTTGSGLGLASSRRIIEHWGGEIAITSEEGKGARVLVALVRPG
ncbi:MAG: hypothetical protein H0W63_05440 [Gemmatimonadaceae bacterium]|nr:hypothetical protein [Gemmatimonadaceae bacterium]